MATQRFIKGRGWVKKKEREKGKGETREQRKSKLRETRRAAGEERRWQARQERRKTAEATPTPKEPKKEGVIERLSPTQRIKAAITGKTKAGKKLSALERVEKVTGAVRNVVLVALAGAAAAGYFGGGAALGPEATAAAQAAEAKAAIAKIYPYGGAKARKLAAIGWKVQGQEKFFSPALRWARAGSFGTAVTTNTKTQALTWKIMRGAGLLVGGAAITYSILGTYPFAGFIGKEEAPQTLEFGYRAAIDAGDLDMADTALDEMDKILYAVDTLGDKTPIVNVMNALKDYVAGAKITVAAQRELVQRMRDGTDKWSIVRQQQKDDAEEIQANRIEQQRVANEESARIRLAAQEARDIEERRILNEELALWAKYKTDLIAQEKKDREEAAAFWLAYTKEKLKLREEQKPSQLGFGLLG